MLRLLYPDRYSDDTDKSKVESASDRYLLTMFDLLNDELANRSSFIATKTGICDLYLAMLMTWYPQPETLYQSYPNLKRMFDSVLLLDQVADVFQRNELV